MISVLLISLPGIALFLYAVTGKMGSLEETSRSTLWVLFLIGVLGFTAVFLLS
jgi:hypothetical protein